MDISKIFQLAAFQGIEYLLNAIRFMCEIFGVRDSRGCFIDPMITIVSSSCSFLGGLVVVDSWLARAWTFLLIVSSVLLTGYP